MVYDRRLTSLIHKDAFKIFYFLKDVLQIISGGKTSKKYESQLTKHK